MIFDLVLPLLALLTPFTILFSFILLGYAYEDYKLYKHKTLEQYKKLRAIYYSIIVISVLIILLNMVVGNITIICCVI